MYACRLNFKACHLAISKGPHVAARFLLNMFPTTRLMVSNQSTQSTSFSGIIIRPIYRLTKKYQLIEISRPIYKRRELLLLKSVLTDIYSVLISRLISTDVTYLIKQSRSFLGLLIRNFKLLYSVSILDR